MSFIDHDSCLIEPKRGRSEEPLPSPAVLVFSSEDLRSFFACFADPVKRTHTLYLSSVYTGSFEGTQVALAGPMLGAPQTILVLEKMIALGVRKIVAMGWCGSLQHHVAIGDVVIPKAAIAEEGTSPHYPTDSPAPSSSLCHCLTSALADIALDAHEGTIWTTDAPFRETFTKVRHFQEQGVLAVDMETSALFAVSRFRGVELAVALVVSDSLSGLRWMHGFREPAFKETRKKVIRSTLKAVCSAAECSRDS